MDDKKVGAIWRGGNHGKHGVHYGSCAKDCRDDHCDICFLTRKLVEERTKLRAYRDAFQPSIHGKVKIDATDKEFALRDYGIDPATWPKEE